MHYLHLKTPPRQLLIVIGLGSLLVTSALVPMRSSHGERLAIRRASAKSRSDESSLSKHSFASVSAQATATLQFNLASYVVGEGDGSSTIAVTRAGDSSSAVTVDYATSDGTASERSDYTTALGTLRFAAG